jgi:hypothetical protein
MMPLYVNRPGDEFGNLAHDPAVIEAEPYQHDILEWMTLLRVSAPEGFNWPTVHADKFQQVPDSAGPPRMLTVEEWQTLVGWGQS